MLNRAIHDATRRQIEAAAPDRSTWLTANAGSGKTKVLTDRVARLLLRGTAPERILCLTYTKAAAAEMQNRLLQRLGGWAMLPDAELREALAEIGAEGDGDLAAARRLFARAIETPGGLKVQTIHAFCAGVLRRFPLEAGVPVGFTELDDRTAAQLRAEIVEELAVEGGEDIADLTTLLHAPEGLDGFLAAVTRAETRFDQPPDPPALWDFLGLPHPYEADRLLAEVLDPEDAEMIEALIPLLRAGGANDGKLAQKLEAHDWHAPGLAQLGLLESVLLFGGTAKTPFAAKVGGIPTKALRLGSCAQYADPLDRLMCRVEEARTRRMALDFAQRSLRLHRFAHNFTRRYAEAKRARGWLDFDDLIARTARLLSSAGMAQWVLFRLDGGIDHILVDEAQDTSPGQWEVIERLAAEFTAGTGTRAAGERTLFVVGDPKQSIYSFQGADIAVFDARRHRFEADFHRIGSPMQDTALLHSFRSSPLILDLVDRVFQGPAAEGLGTPPEHRAFHEGRPGRVDLWPVVPKPDTPPEREWDDPLDQPEADSHIARLATGVAAGIRRMLDEGTRIVTRKGERALEPGDVLILVQRRSELFDAIIRACKSEHLPIAGADRLLLDDEIAVGDIRALLNFIATPEDDLSLAEALRSPLFGLDEAALWQLAAGRQRSLWAELRERGPEEVREAVSDLLRVSGHLRPFELISRILTRHNGRERLLARLGPEAEDGIDELLTQALAYERTAVPSLTGFLVWLDSGETEVRRQAGGGGMVRVMTVHGAKGLESPVVILPDCAKLKLPHEGSVLTLSDRAAVLRGTKGERPEPVETAVAARGARQEEERRRLLYVALTRAESWLIVAAAGEAGAGTESWHAMVTEGFERAVEDAAGEETALPEPVPGAGEGRRLSFGDWPSAAAPVPREPAVPQAEPAWLRLPPEPVARPVRPLAATALGGPKALPGGEGGDAEAAMLRGTRLHLLLEHLPETAAQAADLLATAEGGLPAPDELAGLLAEVEALTTAPHLSEVFTPRAGEDILREVPLTAPLPGLGILSGTVDRLVVGPDRILAIDYKSNAEVPARPEDTPEGILRQMAAYRAALAAIWPGRRVETAILWTRTRVLMPLPDAALDAAAGRVDPALGRA
ncbi:double-strand break repair helicase AddA [Paracoccus sp. S-4012]|uniref:double-strand break repair helicase AddA n=1 Tax=Paracoccus sp. S-4012 TaxID=2665648 RepID=UPI0012AF2165|nr:double-strand break repair helicase AddA [Paracoccus sp. S-4012]MRX49837.1 double-strand break repair helicase AddA [Paracoccus sp. S-4012]